MNVIIGINANHADSSSCIIVNGELIVAIEEERINRIKHYSGYPINSIKECLKIANINDFKQHSFGLNELERDITVFHSKSVSDLSFKYHIVLDFVGFHGQTIFHDSEQKISKQLGDG